MGNTELGEFLRACRARLTPENIGVKAARRARRVPGLRREEVASLAGVSADYYSRLEQGRKVNVSAEVLTAIARALQLDNAERAYLFRVAVTMEEGAPAPGIKTISRTAPGIPQQMIDSLKDTPAFLVGYNMDVLAINRTARILFSFIDSLAAERSNLARLIFCAPAFRDILPTWEDVAMWVVAILRQAPKDESTAALVDELSLADADFLRLWKDYRIPAYPDDFYGKFQVRHPSIGELALNFQCLIFPAESRYLFVLSPVPGDDTEWKMRESVTQAGDFS